MEPLMSLPEVATALNVSTKTMYAWHGLGKGPKPAKIGTRLRYRRADVLEYINAAFCAA